MTYIDDENVILIDISVILRKIIDFLGKVKTYSTFSAAETTVPSQLLV